MLNQLIRFKKKNNNKLIRFQQRLKGAASWENYFHKKKHLNMSFWWSKISFKG